VLSANYILPFPDFLHREYFAKVALINNIYWSAFSINRVKMLNINIKSEEVLKILKIIGGSPSDPDSFKQAKTHLNIWLDCPFNAPKNFLIGEVSDHLLLSVLSLAL
jgi:hypothetical protein